MVFKKKKKSKPILPRGYLQEQILKSQQFRQLQAMSKQRPPSFSHEQRVLQEVMGGGSRNQFWGFGEGPQINHDLNPSARGDFGTQKLFGMRPQQDYYGADNAETGRMFGI